MTRDAEDLARRVLVDLGGGEASAAVAAAADGPLEALLFATAPPAQPSPPAAAATTEQERFERLLHPDSVERWAAFCAAAEQAVLRPDAADAMDDAPPMPSAGVFGRCRRCRSARLIVSTRQLRRSDEGATEIRQCRDCGHVTTVNS